MGLDQVYAVKATDNLYARWSEADEWLKASGYLHALLTEVVTIHGCSMTVLRAVSFADKGHATKFKMMFA